LISLSRDIDGLSENIIRLMNDRKLLELISRNGQKKIYELDWHESCRQLVGLFEKSLNLD